jgi:hypothetical protein
LVRQNFRKYLLFNYTNDVQIDFGRMVSEHDDFIHETDDQSCDDCENKDNCKNKAAKTAKQQSEGAALALGSRGSSAAAARPPDMLPGC